MKMPSIFISHGGGPWPWMEWGAQSPYEGLERYLKELPASLPAPPKAILIISGHWEEQDFTIMTHPQPPMFYDYYGFPEATYQVQYPALVSLPLVARVKELLKEGGIKLNEDPKRGLDHGVFVPLAVSYPRADVPIAQLSMKKSYDVQEHLELGRALAPLRDEGILIVGSGLSYHNLREFGQPRAIPASQLFDDWLAETLTGSPSARSEKLIHWSEAPAARLAHPREDHLIPLMVAVGAAEKATGRKVYDDKMFGLKVSGYAFA